MNTNSRVYRMLVIGLSALVIAGLLFSAGPVAATLASNQIDLVGPAGSGHFGGDVTVLPNGNIVVADSGYDSGAVADVGAVYLYNGMTGTLISTLTGAAPGDKVGDQPVVVLEDGNYLVSSSEWANGGAAKAGAVTWCSAASGCAGAVSPANSLVGGSANDQVGYSWIHPALIGLNGGNYVVTSISWTNGTEAEAGAVTWCAAGGCTGPVSTANSLVGSSSGDVVGRSVTVLTNGSYVVNSITWSDASTEMVGAVTWCDGLGSCNGQAVSAANSLVGSQEYDFVGSGGVLALSNGSYVVGSPDWDIGTVVDAGAATWCSGTGGCVGPVNTANSLVGSQEDDKISYYKGLYGIEARGLQALDNGSYVVRSSYWDNGAAVDAGAVTWCNGAGSCNGKVVGASNSLVGIFSDEQLGIVEITPLTNGYFLVGDPNWDDNRSALTWCSDTAGCSGEISETNSVVDLVYYYYPLTGEWWTPVVFLSNGDVVILDLNLGNQHVMWCSGSEGCRGTITSGNSLTYPGSDWDNYSVTPLDNGNYVVETMGWSNGGMMYVGAVTWCSGSGECNGQVVSAANSLVGSSAEDWVGTQVIALNNSAYAVVSPHWSNGTALEVGAITLCDGQGGCNGMTVTPANSLIGAIADDRIGAAWDGTNRSFALKNGGYVVVSPNWQSGGIHVGAVTVCSAGGSCTGQVVSSANSLVGSANNMMVYGFFVELTNGNVVLNFSYWPNGAENEAGAVTWCNGIEGCHGVVSAANSLVGIKAHDLVGKGHFPDGDGNGVIALANGSYAVLSSYWDNGAGAVTWCSGVSACTGDVASANSVLGLAPNGGASLSVVYDAHNNQLVVSRPADNRVTLLKPRYDHQVYLPLLRR